MLFLLLLPLLPLLLLLLLLWILLAHAVQFCLKQAHQDEKAGLRLNAFEHVLPANLVNVLLNAQRL